VPAKAPLDVDLEDKLVYGLTPIRLAYLVVALLAAFSAWTTQWAAPPVRGGAALLVFAVGVVAAWGRWRGRGADGWILNFATFVFRTYHIEWTWHWAATVHHRAKTVSKSDPNSEQLPLAA
jgi:hypothetical protein